MKAMVLAAGMGTRLGGLTEACPKPMLDVQGQPILAYILSNLAFHGFRDLVINLHFLPEAIESHFGDGARWGIRIAYVHEDRLLGTAGSVKHAEALLQSDEPILVHYGDVLTNQDLGAMVAAHQANQADLTLLLHQRANSNSIVAMDANHRIQALLERPDDASRATVASPWVNSGVYLMNPSVIRDLPTETPCDFPRDLFPGLIQMKRVFGFPLTGYRCAIDSPERLEKARQEIADLGWRPWEAP